MSEIDIDELRSELDEYSKPAKAEGPSAKAQRILAGFEEIERFYEEHGRLPEHGEERDIFERLYAVRLDRLRASEECRAVLEGRDSKGLLNLDRTETTASTIRETPPKYGAGKAGDTSSEASDVVDEDELLATLRAEGAGGGDVAALQHVRSREEIRAAEEVAKRSPCLDFHSFRPVFEKVQRQLDSGERRTFKYQDYANVQIGDLFILDGQKVLVAGMGEEFISDYGRPDRRLRVIYDNGTESDLLLRSLQRALNKDKTSRRISDPSHGSLFSEKEEESDLPTGIIYVLRSKSEHPFVVQNRNLLHKIGVTKGDLKARIAHAEKDPTYLLAGVDVVATFKISNISLKKMEGLVHKFFAEARLDVQLKDRFGFQVEPREWFLLPVSVIEEFTKKIIDGTISNYHYNLRSAVIQKNDSC